MSIQKLAIKFIETKDEQTFNQLQKRLTPGLNSFLYSYIKDKDSRDSIILNTFVNVWTKIEQYSTKFAFSTWVYSIAKNEALQLKRKNSKNNNIENIMKFGDHVNVNADLTFTPEYEFFDETTKDDEINELSEFILEEIKTLSNNYKEVIEMRELKEMKYQDIAAELNMNINTVKTRVRLARLKLLKRAKEKYPNIIEKHFNKQMIKQ